MKNGSQSPKRIKYFWLTAFFLVGLNVLVVKSFWLEHLVETKKTTANSVEKALVNTAENPIVLEKTKRIPKETTFSLAEESERKSEKPSHYSTAQALDSSPLQNLISAINAPLDAHEDLQALENRVMDSLQDGGNEFLRNVLEEAVRLNQPTAIKMELLGLFARTSEDPEDFYRFAQAVVLSSGDDNPQLKTQVYLTAMDHFLDEPQSALDVALDAIERETDPALRQTVASVFRSRFSEMQNEFEQQAARKGLIIPSDDI